MENQSIDRGLLMGFAEEVRGYVPRVVHRLESLPDSGPKAAALEEPHRLVHSIKGAASMIGLTAMSHCAYLVELGLEEVGAGVIAWNPQVRLAFQQSVRALGTYMDLLLSGSPKAKESIEWIVAEFLRIKGHQFDRAAIERILGNCEVRIDSFADDPPALPPPSPAPAAAMHHVGDDLLAVFQQEAEEILHELGEILERCKNDDQLVAALPEVRRRVHTLKGAAGSVGIVPMSRLAHRLEDLLDELNDGLRGFDASVKALVLAGVDLLSEIADAPRSPHHARRVDEVVARLEAALLPASPAPRPATEESTDPISADLLDAFRAEVDENLRLIGEHLRALEADSSSRTPLLEVRRLIHTMKGASNVVGLGHMADICHRFESLVQHHTEGTGALDEASTKVLFGIVDVLSDGFAGDIEPAELPAAFAAVVERRDGKPALPAVDGEAAFNLPSASAEEQSTGDAAAKTPTRAGQFVRVPIARLDALVRLASELVVNRSTFEQHLAAYQREVAEMGLSIDRLRRVSGNLPTDYEVTNLKSGAGQLAVRAVFQTDKRSEFDTLEFDRYTNLHLASRDLTETASDIESAVGELSHRAGDFDSFLNRLNLLTGDLQDGLMRLRMVPLASIATRLHRTVRTTASKVGKQAELVIDGENVEFDKTVLEEICGPLEHLLRNAVDHGLESESMRTVLGKPARGRIVIQARNEGTQVALRITDDGAGMDPGALRAAAIRTGMMNAERANGLSDQEACELIFEPGFTTARQISETSGRGVGMDVVRETVRQLKGTVQLDTRYGAGTAFTIRLPMTLAVLRVLLVRANDETLAIPLSVISQIRRIEPNQLEKVGTRQVIRVDGDVMPAAHLGELLQFSSPPDQSVQRRPVLVMNIGDQRIGVIVDRLLEAREVVVKGLGSVVRKAHGISGSTLMGDGSVVLIVNPSELAPSVSEEPARGITVSAATTTRRALDVMVVDDSVSVRRVLTNLVKTNGWNPHAAKDGMEALEMLQRGYQPDVILLDIEMPRMDGYELTAAVRAIPSLARLPIVMLTSRSGEKHRKKAFEMGATDYLVKPYQEDTLLTVVRRVVREYREAIVS